MPIAAASGCGASVLGEAVLQRLQRHDGLMERVERVLEEFGDLADLLFDS
jgi:hypothetical protein